MCHLLSLEKNICYLLWNLTLYSIKLEKWLKSVDGMNVLHIWRVLWMVWICLWCRRLDFNPWVGKIPWRRTWQPTPVFLPGESPWAEEPGGLHWCLRPHTVHGVAKSRTKHRGWCDVLIPFGCLSFQVSWFMMRSPRVDPSSSTISRGAGGLFWTWVT